MKQLLIILFAFAVAQQVSAQESFQKELFTADVVLKYRTEIGLTEQQVERVKKIYADHISIFNSKKWDLDAELLTLNKSLTQVYVDEKVSLAQLEKIRVLEDELKRMKLAMLIKIKNELKEPQQEQLKKLRTDKDLASEGTTTIISENPKLMIRAIGNQAGERPVFIVNGERMTDLQNIDPDRIESMAVLKGATAAALYGSDAKNGAIVITLRK